LKGCLSFEPWVPQPINRRAQPIIKLVCDIIMLAVVFDHAQHRVNHAASKPQGFK